MPPAQLSGDRRAALADATLEVLCDAGSRGLTHRAVDRAAGLPAGSTGNYFPTRAKLVAAAADRLVAHDLEDIGQPSAAAAGAHELGVAIARIITRLLAPARRRRQVARFELLLHAGRDPALEGTFAPARRRFVALAERALAGAGCPEPALHAPALVALFDGLLADQLMHPATAIPRSRLAGHIADALRGFGVPPGGVRPSHSASARPRSVTGGSP